MRVFIILRDVDHEGGEIRGVHTHLEDAQEDMRSQRIKVDSDTDISWSIEQWVIQTGPQVKRGEPTCIHLYDGSIVRMTHE